jgi:L-asparaginase II
VMTQAVTTQGMARAFMKLGTAKVGTSAHKVAEAMLAHPEVCGGKGRNSTELMKRVPRAIVKEGAEGVCAFVLPNGSAGAIKIDDGAGRALKCLVHACFTYLGFITIDEQASLIRETGVVPVSFAPFL